MLHLVTLPLVPQVYATSSSCTKFGSSALHHGEIPRQRDGVVLRKSGPDARSDENFVLARVPHVDIDEDRRVLRGWSFAPVPSPFSSGRTHRTCQGRGAAAPETAAGETSNPPVKCAWTGVWSSVTPLGLRGHAPDARTFCHVEPPRCRAPCIAVRLLGPGPRRPGWHELCVMRVSG
mgnify:CR=1 FL=1